MNVLSSYSCFPTLATTKVTQNLFFVVALVISTISVAQVPTEAPVRERSIISDSLQQAPPLLQPKQVRPDASVISTEPTSPRSNTTSQPSPSPIVSESLPIPAQPTISEAKAGSWTIPHEQHPWARFGRGAWRELQIRTESFDENGLLLGQTITLRREVLVDKSPTDYRLRVESIVEVEGKRLPTAVQEITLQLVNDSVVAPSEIRELDATTINRQGQAVPCTVWELETAIDQGKRLEQVYYSYERAPHVLRRVRDDIIDGQTVSKLETRLAQDGLPVLIDNRLQAGRHLITTNNLAGGGRRDRFELQADKIPGGLVRASESEYRQTGVLARWTTTTLLQAGAAPSNNIVDNLRNLVRSRIEAPGVRPVPSQPIQPRPAPNRPDPESRSRSGDTEDEEEDRRRRQPRESEEDDEEETPRRLLRLLKRAEAAAYGAENPEKEY